MHMRNKKESAITADALRQATAIIKEFSDFTLGIRVLQLMQRKSDGGKCQNIKIKSVIVKDTLQFKIELAKMIELKDNSSEPLRVYSSACSRNLKKAVRYFKQCQLDIDYGSDEMFEGLYFHIHSRFVSALMQTSSKIESFFLLDLDQTDNTDVLIKLAKLNIAIIKLYPTKQGWHVITQPFNPALFESTNCSIHKNGMLLLSY